MIFDVFRKSGTHRTLTPQQLEEILTRGGETATGLSVSPETAARFGAVFSCVKVRAESIGQLPLHLFETRDRDKTPAESHYLYPLLKDAPNEAMTSQEFWEWAVASMDLRGNAYVFQNWLPSGKLFELLPLDARWVEVKLDQKRDITYTVRIPNQEPVIYGPRQVLHLKAMSLNGITGASVIEQGRETIALGMALEKHGAKFFKNGGAPGGVLKTDQLLDDETYKKLEKTWDARNAGLDNAHRVAILEAGLSWQSVGVNLKDAQFLEGRKFSRSEICGLFRVPPHLIGDLDRATFSNIEQQGLDFVIHGLMPTITRIEQRIKLQLLKPEERARFFAKFNERGLLRGDMKSRADYYTALVNIGVLSPNDVREKEDLNPRKGGDVYLTPMNMAVNGKPPVAPAEPPAKEPEDGEGKDETDEAA